MAVKPEHREMALTALRHQANANWSREDVILGAFHAAVCGIDDQGRAEVTEAVEEIANDPELERGVRKVAGWHLAALTAVRDTLALTSENAGVVA